MFDFYKLNVTTNTFKNIEIIIENNIYYARKIFIDRHQPLDLFVYTFPGFFLLKIMNNILQINSSLKRDILCCNSCYEYSKSVCVCKNEFARQEEFLKCTVSIKKIEASHNNIINYRLCKFFSLQNHIHLKNLQFLNPKQKYFRQFTEIHKTIQYFLNGCLKDNKELYLSLFWSLRYLYKIDEIVKSDLNEFLTVFTINQQTDRATKEYYDEIIAQQIVLLHKVQKMYNFSNYQTKKSRMKRIYLLLNFIFNEKNEQIFNSRYFFDHRQTIRSINLADIQIFRSANYPIRIQINAQNKKFNILYKSAKNQQNDFSILCISEYFSFLLKLKIPKYKIQLIDSNTAIIEMIDAIPIKNEHIDKFQKSSFKLQKNCIKTAVFCVLLIYLLGIGDRHSDNFLITKNLKIFQIDFAFILGNDPKPFTTEFKIPKIIQKIITIDKMVMSLFLHYFFKYFLKLRRNRNKIYLFNHYLYIHPVCEINPDKLNKFIDKKFLMEHELEDVERILFKKLKKSLNSKLMNIYEFINIFGKYFRN